MSLIIKAASKITPDQARRLDAVCELAYGPDDDDLTWTDEEDWRMWLEVEGELVSCLTIIERDARVGDVAVRLGGIGGVATLPSQQHKGYAGRVMLGAADFLHETLRVDFGHLLCSPELVAYYASFGWQPLAAPLWIDQPGGKVALQHSHMMLPCSGRSWPAGTLDLCGLPW